MTSENIKCPKCGALSDQVTNLEEMQNALGIHESDMQWMCNSCGEMFNQEEETLDYSELSISDIAYRIINDWKEVPRKALTYLEPMTELEDINDHYGLDTGEQVVAHFLVNAHEWKGEVVREIKKELNRRLK